MQVDAQVVAQVPDGGDAAAPDVGNGGGSGTGEQPAGVVATEQHGREVQHVAVDQPGPVEIPGHRCAALDQYLQHLAAPQLVEHVTEVAVEFQGGVDLGALGRPAEHDP